MTNRNRREDLLDAAERLFAERGYHGASMRDIAAEANVQLSLSRYYFGSKEQLYQVILERHSDALIGLQEGSLDQLLERTPAPSLEQVVDAYVRPYVSQALREPSLRRYIRILYQLAAFDERRSLGAWLFTPHERVAARYVDALLQALPGAERDRIRAAYLLIRQMALGFIANALADTATPDPARFAPELVPLLVAFAAAGVRGVAAFSDGTEGHDSQ